MLHFLAAADLHGFPENLQMALAAHPETDCVLLAGDYEFPYSVLRKVCGDLPLFAVRGNNDLRDSSLPDELVLDLLPGIDGADPLLSRLRVFTPDADACPPRAPEVLTRILITHGHFYLLPELEAAYAGLSGLKIGRRRLSKTLYARAAELGADVTVFGHSHLYYEGRRESGGLLVNPGTLSGYPGLIPEICSYAILTLSRDGLRIARRTLPD